MWVLGRDGATKLLYLDGRWVLWDTREISGREKERNHGVRHFCGALFSAEYGRPKVSMAYMQIPFCASPAHEPPLLPRAANITCANLRAPRHLIPSFTHHHCHVLNSSHCSGSTTLPPPPPLLLNTQSPCPHQTVRTWPSRGPWTSLGQLQPLEDQIDDFGKVGLWKRGNWRCCIWCVCRTEGCVSVIYMILEGVGIRILQ